MAIAVSANVSRTNIFSQSYANLYNLINSRSNVPDPRGNIRRKFIYRRTPNTMKRGFEGYPFIVISPAMPDITNLTLSVTNADVEMEFEVSVWSSDEIPGKHNAKGAEYLDTISDNLMATINSDSNKATLRGYRQARTMIVTDDTDVIDERNETIFVRRFTISHTTRLLVSA